MLPPTAGYNRLENQLYRVEVHTTGPRGTATFKWSRDNASVETTIEKIAGDIVTVADVGPDEVLGFAGSQWVEIVDEESSLKREPHPLAQIDKIDPATREITLKTSLSSLAGRPGLKLRRWDQSGASASASGVSTSLQNWIDLEGGMQVRFSQTGDFQSGDFWVIPARTATGEIEWPPFDIPNTAPIPQPPLGVRHHYARLATRGRHRRHDLDSRGLPAAVSAADRDLRRGHLLRERQLPARRRRHRAGGDRSAVPGARPPLPQEAPARLGHRLRPAGLLRSGIANRDREARATRSRAKATTSGSSATRRSICST